MSTRYLAQKPKPEISDDGLFGYTQMQRKNLMPAFQYRHVKDLYAIFWSKSREMVEAVTEHVNEKGPAHHVEDAPVIELGSWTRRATLDIIGLACLGQDFNSMQDPNSELNHAYRRLPNPFHKPRYPLSVTSRDESFPPHRHLRPPSL